MIESDIHVQARQFLKNLKSFKPDTLKEPYDILQQTQGLGIIFYMFCYKSLDISNTIHNLLETDRKIKIIHRKRAKSIVLVSIFISVLAISLILKMATRIETSFLIGFIALTLTLTRVTILNSEHFKDTAVKRLSRFFFTEFVNLYDAFKENSQIEQDKFISNFVLLKNEIQLLKNLKENEEFLLQQFDIYLSKEDRLPRWKLVLELKNVGIILNCFKLLEEQSGIKYFDKNN